MILVTVGHKGFDRLIQAMDDFAAAHEEEIIMQVGYRPRYIPRHARFFDFVSRAQMQVYLEQARLLVSHCSVGSILSALALGKPLVAVPRLHAYGEHVDDHQLELARELENEKIIDHLFVLHDINALPGVIAQARHATIGYVSSGRKEALLKTIRDFVNETHARCGC